MVGEVLGRPFSLHFPRDELQLRIRKFRDLHLSHDLQNPPDVAPASAFELDPHSCFLTLCYFPSFSRVLSSLLFPSLSHDYSLKSTKAPFTLRMNRVYCASKSLRIEMMKNSSGRDYVSDEFNRNNWEVDD